MNIITKINFKHTDDEVIYLTFENKINELVREVRKLKKEGK